MKFLNILSDYPAYAIMLFLSSILIFSGCAYFQDELSPSRIYNANTYKEDIVSQKCANGDTYYKYHLRLIGYSQKPHIFGFMDNDCEHYDTLVYDTPGEVESILHKKLKDKGLFINYIKYIKTDCGDTYVVVWGSPKPSRNCDWKELRRHHKILELKNLKEKFPSITNEVPKCECRYCTSGLDRKYWR